MKKLSTYFAGIMFAMLLLPASSWAEMVRGQVTAINKDNQSITVMAVDESGASQGQKELTLAPDAQFSGIQSIDDLQVGDQIQADVNKKMFGNDEIKQLTSTKGGQVNASAGENLSASGQASTSGQTSSGVNQTNEKQKTPPAMDQSLRDKNSNTNTNAGS